MRAQLSKDELFIQDLRLTYRLSDDEISTWVDNADFSITLPDHL